MQRERSWGRSRGTKRRCCTSVFEDTRKGHGVRNERNGALDARKGQEMDSFLEPPEGASSWQPVGFGSLKLVSYYLNFRTT